MRPTNGSSGVHPGVHDLAPIRGCIPAIDVAAGQVDHDVGPIDNLDPFAEFIAVPSDD